MPLIGDEVRCVSSSKHELRFRVTLLVLGQVIAAHECFLAVGADVLLFASVGASVTAQFIRARKGFVTVWPGAEEWLLT